MESAYLTAKQVKNKDLVAHMEDKYCSWEIIDTGPKSGGRRYYDLRNKSKPGSSKNRIWITIPLGVPMPEIGTRVEFLPPSFPCKQEPREKTEHEE